MCSVKDGVHLRGPASACGFSSVWELVGVHTCLINFHTQIPICVYVCSRWQNKLASRYPSVTALFWPGAAGSVCDVCEGGGVVDSHHGALPGPFPHHKFKWMNHAGDICSSDSSLARSLEVRYSCSRIVIPQSVPLQSQEGTPLSEL